MTVKEICLVGLAVLFSLAMFSMASSNVLMLVKGTGGGGACNLLDFSQVCNSQYLALGGIP